MNAWWHCVEADHTPKERVLLGEAEPSRLVSYSPKTFTDFAREMGYSRSYLTRKLSVMWECSPGKVLRRVRLEEGARLLRTTQLSVRDIADKIGYSSTEAFSKAFTRQYGHSPRAYRRAET
jgi:AraC-like DNA-binding protein